MTIKTPDNSYINTSPNIVVNVYPNGGSQVSTPILITGGGTGILSAVIYKNIRDDGGGKFSFILPPGGPKGVNDSISWTNIITPLSVVVIGLQRGASKRIIMVGLVTSVQETQEWQRSTVTRTITVQGVDFTYYFNSFSYYTLAFLGFLESNTSLGLAGFIQAMNGKTLQSVVCQQGQQWFSDVMVGQPNNVPTTLQNINPSFVAAKPILGNTYVWVGNQQLFLNQLFGYWFEGFVENGSTAFIPLMTDFLQSEGAWIEKFKVIFPWPYYEFFVITANANDYPDNSGYPGVQGASTTNTSAVGYGNIPLSANQFSIPNFPSVYPMVIARVNPLPWAAVNAPGSAPLKYTQDRWINLPTYQLSPYGFISSTVAYSVNELANFFLVVTTESYAASQASNSNSSLTFAAEFNGVYYSQHSINEYGFRSRSVNIRWLSVLNPSLTADFTKNGNFYSQFLLGKLASYYITTPYMLNGVVTIPMWPDIIPGCRFIYTPFKNQADYMFYIEGVTHTYNFGGMCTTSLELSRGLLKSDWEDPNDLMLLLHTDNVDVVDGKLTQRTATTNDGLKYAGLASTPAQPSPNPATAGKPNLSTSPPPAKYKPTS